MDITLSFQLNPLFVEIDLDLKSAHMLSSRDWTEEELESDVIFHCLLEIFNALYGKTLTPKYHYIWKWTGPSTHERPHADRCLRAEKCTRINLL
jgi:hypothetical protein